MERLIDNKSKLQETLVTFLRQYHIKYIRKIHHMLEDTLEPKDKHKLLKKFQKILKDVPQWSESYVEKEYNKFLKWAKNKCRISKDEYEELCNKLISCLVKIISYSYTQDCTVEGQQLFYKTLKKTARFFYESPHLIQNVGKQETRQVDEIIETTIDSFVPLKDILHFLETSKDEEDVVYPYSFTKDNDVPLHVEKQEETDSADQTPIDPLRYISSDEFYKEYYDSEDEKEQKQIKQQIVNDGEEKQINLPIYKKSLYSKKNFSNGIPFPAHNEKKENFFSD